jgi:DNA-binding NtrC family response regulator
MGAYLRGRVYHYKRMIDGRTYYRSLKIHKSQEPLLSGRIKQVDDEITALHFGLVPPARGDLPPLNRSGYNEKNPGGEIIRDGDLRLEREDWLQENAGYITPESLRRALSSCRWNKARTANEIGKSRRQLYRLLEKYRMDDCIRKGFFF